MRLKTAVTPRRVRARRTHYEDWLAVLVFNHLIAGADAYVAAQLWDLPDKVAIRQTPFGPAIAATLAGLLAVLTLAACDKCGGFQHINYPGQPKTCHDDKAG